MIVYWIKRKDMSDPYSEGYIGVTAFSIQKRFEQHSKNIYKKSIVKKAIDKYDDIEIVELHMAGRKWFYNPETLQNKRLHNRPDGWLPGKVHAK